MKFFKKLAKKINLCQNRYCTTGSFIRSLIPRGVPIYIPRFSAWYLSNTGINKKMKFCKLFLQNCCSKLSQMVHGFDFLKQEKHFLMALQREHLIDYVANECSCAT